MARLPGKLATALLLAIALAGSLVWIAAPVIFPEKTPVLTDFLDILHERSKQLAPDARLPVPIPPLRAGETVIVAMGPRVTVLGKDLDLSKGARSVIERTLSTDGPELTFLYLVDKGEVRGRAPVSRCNLTLAGREPFVVTPSSTRIAFIECGPIGTSPGECRDIVGLWNERCAARLVPE